MLMSVSIYLFVQGTVSSHPKGIYLIKVYSGNEVFVEKVVYN